MGSVSVVIVTHNSSVFMSRLIYSLECQTKMPDLVVIVDSGSTSTEYLDRLRTSALTCSIILKSNIGFAAGSNEGWRISRDHDFVLFLNPDAFLTPDYLEQSIQFMEDEAQQNVGMLTGTLLGYNISQDCPTGFVDSTGIMQTWYGRSYDRDQGAPTSVLKKYGGKPNAVPAICGAAMLARQAALSSVSVGGNIFQSDYFMYKEDIDLSWRVARAGWTLIHHPDLAVYHCRGWKSRTAMPKALRLLSAKNEIKMFYKHRSPYIFFGLIKYCGVKLLNL